MNLNEIEFLIYDYSTNWVIHYYEDLKYDKKQEFLELLNTLLKYINNVELFFYNLKYYLKESKKIKDIEYQLLFDASMPFIETPLSDEGYNMLYDKYKDDLANELHEVKLELYDDQSDSELKPVEPTDEIIYELI